MRRAQAFNRSQPCTSMTAGERLKAWARRIKRDGVTLWFACKSPKTPWYAKALGAFVVAYALSPIDLIPEDRKSTRLNSSHSQISYAVFCLKKKKNISCSHLWPV